MKNKKHLGHETCYTPVAEFTTSKHDALAIRSSLGLFKYNCEQIIGPAELCQFRVVVIDYSWPSILSFVEEFNIESVADYASHMLQVIIVVIFYQVMM
jgi:hypothetical protein